MADYNTHTYFGMRVLEQLPTDLRRQMTQDLPAFRLGLYGPDPLIFLPWTKREACRYHQVWRQEGLPRLTRAMEGENPTQASFAAGCILHLMLDDVVHPWIKSWIKEGSSHFRLELGLDRLIVQEQGLDHLPRLVTKGKERTAQAAAELLPNTQADNFLWGLRNMDMSVAYLRRWGESHEKRITEAEHSQIRFLRVSLEEAIRPTSAYLEELLEPAPAGV